MFFCVLVCFCVFGCCCFGVVLFLGCVCVCHVLQITCDNYDMFVLKITYDTLFNKF